MEFPPQQTNALDSVSNWLRNQDKQIYRLFGFAGTGKTWLAKYIADKISGTVLFAAYTGKAALVLREKKCYGATTIHGLIYLPKGKSSMRLMALRKELKEKEELADRLKLESQIEAESSNLKKPAFVLNTESKLKGAKLLIVDEVSMVDDRIGKDLLSFGIPILTLGDPAQLPPIKSAGFFINEQPDIMLTEIHRQAQDSPIIHLATKVRKGEMIENGEYGSSRVMDKGILTIGEMAKFNQIIVGTNKTRKRINGEIRDKVRKYKTHLPVPGDLLICVKNNHNMGLLNGSQWIVNDVIEFQDEDLIGLEIYSATSEDKYVFKVCAFKHYFEDRVKEISPFSMGSADHFDFGYAITCHKSQGSQWDNICVVDESHVFRGMQSKWLYTAITRAANSVTITR